MNYGIGNVKAKSSGGVSGGNVWQTYTGANFIDGEATFSIGNIIKPNDMTLNIADKILYVDANDKIVECYLITDIGDISVTLEKIGDFGASKQLYQHNIFISKANNTYISLSIINSDNSLLDTPALLANYLYTNGLLTNQKILMAQGFKYNTNSSDFSNNVMGLFSENGTTLKAHCKTGYTGVNPDLNITTPDTMVDTIITL